jgi:hypothetical protein
LKLIQHRAKMPNHATAIDEHQAKVLSAKLLSEESGVFFEKLPCGCGFQSRPRRGRRPLNEIEMAGGAVVDTLQEALVVPAASGLDLICEGVRLISRDDATALERGVLV